MRMLPLPWYLKNRYFVKLGNWGRYLSNNFLYFSRYFCCLQHFPNSKKTYKKREKNEKGLLLSEFYYLFLSTVTNHFKYNYSPFGYSCFQKHHQICHPASILAPNSGFRSWNGQNRFSNTAEQSTYLNMGFLGCWDSRKFIKLSSGSLFTPQNSNFTPERSKNEPYLKNEMKY